jgi:serine/threonine-protein kinase 24/25/MST4
MAHLGSQQAIRDDMDAREIESLSMLSRGFTELKEANPELAYNVILDVLSGINEYVAVAYSITSILIIYSSQQLCSASACSNLPRFVPAQTHHSQE